jgi:dTDP-4-amino-4,6-dideoxygalactose transaminase
MKIARERNIRVIEDAAHALGSKYKNKFLGTIGDIGCFSFYNTKNLTCGEGGAIVTNSEKLAEKIEIIRGKGTNRSVFIRGEVDKYTWVYKGSSYVLSDILAAIIYEQIKKLEKIMQLRKGKASYYNKKLEHLKNMLIIPQVKPECDMCWHIYAIRVDPRMRDIVLNELKREKIDAAFHFIPLHSSPYGKQILGRRNPRLPITDLVSSYPFTNIYSADTKRTELYS